MNHWKTISKTCGVRFLRAMIVAVKFGGPLSQIWKLVNL
jgi:hypothetical protein